MPEFFSSDCGAKPREMKSGFARGCLMRRTVAVIVVSIVKPVASAKKQRGDYEDACED